jgi:prepilin-type N-terminal cleavage/methylation domain-containing protein
MNVPRDSLRKFTLINEFCMDCKSWQSTESKVFLARRGFSLIELLMAMAISGIVMVGIASISITLTRQQTQSTSALQLGILQNSISQVLNSTQAWNVTVADAGNQSGGGNPLYNLLCEYNATKYCTSDNTATGTLPSAYSRIPIVKNSSGAVILDTTSQNAGFNMQGQSCTTFVPMPGTLNYSAYAVGNDQCPFRFEVMWLPNCTSNTTCNGQPQASLKLILYYNPGASKISGFNPDNYSSSFVRGVAAATGGTTISLSCAWGAAFAPGSCAPPACPGGWTDLGTNDTTSSIGMNGATANMVGTSFRNCYSSQKFDTALPACSWSTTSTVTSCIPPACPVGWSNLGTGNAASGIGMNGATANIVGTSQRFCIK